MLRSLPPPLASCDLGQTTRGLASAPVPSPCSRKSTLPSPRGVSAGLLLANAFLLTLMVAFQDMVTSALARTFMVIQSPPCSSRKGLGEGGGCQGLTPEAELETRAPCACEAPPCLPLFNLYNSLPEHWKSHSLW